MKAAGAGCTTGGRAQQTGVFAGPWLCVQDLAQLRHSRIADRVKQHHCDSKLMMQPATLFIAAVRQC